MFVAIFVFLRYVKLKIAIMKKFIVGFTKVFPWVYLIGGIIMIAKNPPRRGPEFYGYREEDPVMALVLLAGVILTTLLFVGFSYIVEASCKYLDSIKPDVASDQ